MTLKDLIVLSPEVQAALDAQKPVIALESTIITHGMPWPQNLDTALHIEHTIRDEGVIAATIAVIDNKIRVGLSKEELTSLAQTKNVRKLSRADLAHALVQGDTGSTTVAATMLCAHLAGIKVFATGGLGGVHRDVIETMDVSADLGEFQRTPILVVCAGVKAILDIPKTLETLETLGIPVLTFNAENFPAFWSRDSGLKSPLRLNTAEQIANLAETRAALGQSEGIIVANPVPINDEISSEEMEPYIAQALEEAEQQSIIGKEVTPFLLQRIYELTSGKSLATNIALVENNARLASQIAKKLT